MANKKIVINFFADVNDKSVSTLMDTINKKMREGIKDFVILISSAGGSVNAGLTAYNFLKGIPANITTHNIGNVDSIAAPIFCGGKIRYSVSQSRFLLHGVSWSFPQGYHEEKRIEEALKSLRVDTQNIAKVLAVTSGKTVEEANIAMMDRTVLNSEDAKTWGLVTEIKDELFESGLEVISINN